VKAERVNRIIVTTSSVELYITLPTMSDLEKAIEAAGKFGL
jgi:hypothetical protein